MCDQLIERETPDWLLETDGQLGDLPLRDVLDGSVFYPAAGFDGLPVKHLHRFFPSFVYVDYGVTEPEALQDLNTFKGYRVLARRRVTAGELTHGRWAEWVLPEESSGGRRPVGGIKPPFAQWAVLEREDAFGTEHGPDRFSIVYIGGEGVTIYRAIYNSNRITPRVVVIIQPGTGFGENWTDFEDPGGSFCQTVYENPVGKPGFLMFGGWGPSQFYLKPCWPEYSQEVCEITPSVRLWHLA